MTFVVWHLINGWAWTDIAGLLGYWWDLPLTTSLQGNVSSIKKNVYLWGKKDWVRGISLVVCKICMGQSTFGSHASHQIGVSSRSPEHQELIDEEADHARRVVSASPCSNTKVIQNCASCWGRIFDNRYHRTCAYRACQGDLLIAECRLITTNQGGSLKRGTWEATDGPCLECWSVFAHRMQSQQQMIAAAVRTMSPYSNRNFNIPFHGGSWCPQMSHK